MPTKRKQTNRRNKITKTKYRKRTTRKCKRPTRRTRLNWDTILSGAKTVGNALLGGSKFISNIAGAAFPMLNSIVSSLNIANNIKNAISSLLKDDENDEPTLDTQKMKSILQNLSRTLVSKAPQMREHPFYTEIHQLYDDIDFIEQFQSTWDRMEAQKQIYSVMQRFKKILVEYNDLTK